MAKLQGGAYESLHLAEQKLPFEIGLPIGATNGFQAGEFTGEFRNLVQRNMRGASTGFAVEDLAEEYRELAAMWSKGITQDLHRQTVSKFAACDDALRVTASIGAPRNEGVVLLRRGPPKICQVTVWQEFHQAGVRRWTFDSAALVTVTKNVGLKSHGRVRDADGSVETGGAGRQGE